MQVERLHDLLPDRSRERPEIRDPISIQRRHTGRDVQPKILGHIWEKRSHVDRREATEEYPDRAMRGEVRCS